MNLPRELRQTDEYQRLGAMIDCLDANGDPELAWAHRATGGIQSEGKRLGIFSGSFNPLTVAHVKMIEESQKQFKLDEILLCLAKSNVDKGVFGFSLADRLFMLKRYATQKDDFSDFSIPSITPTCMPNWPPFSISVVSSRLTEKSTAQKRSGDSCRNRNSNPTHATLT